MIRAEDLIGKFRQALEDKWGYIWGQSGTQWTQSDQTQKVNYMISKYGANWQKNQDAKKDNYYMSAMYGAKWIGHKVADCSGLFVWAYRQYGEKIAHGSNSIYDSYCSKKGKLTEDLKKTIRPGTAVFTGDASQHGHIGLYVGSGKCIEAEGTQAGVVTSNLKAGKWTYYGELKAVNYEGAAEPEKPAEPAEEPAAGSTLPTLRKGSKGEYVTLLQTKLVSKGYSVGPCGIDGDFGSATLAAVKQVQRDNGLAVDGIVGKNTWAALNDTTVQIVRYTVEIPHLTEAQADELMKKYSGATKLAERG